MRLEKIDGFEGIKDGYIYEIVHVKETDANGNSTLFYNGYIRLLEEHELPSDIMRNQVLDSIIVSYDAMESRINESTAGRWIGFTTISDENPDDVNNVTSLVYKTIDEISKYVPRERKDVKLELVKNSFLFYIDEENIPKHVVDDLTAVVDSSSSSLLDLSITCFVEAVASPYKPNLGIIHAACNTKTIDPYDVRYYIITEDIAKTGKSRYELANENFDRYVYEIIKEVERVYNCKITISHEDVETMKSTFLKSLKIRKTKGSK